MEENTKNLSEIQNKGIDIKIKLKKYKLTI
jgi:hypothetical protein